MWEKKYAALSSDAHTKCGHADSLEEAIATAYHTQSTEQVEKVLDKLVEINEAENSLNTGGDQRLWRVVCVFVTFEHDEHYQAALELGKITIGGQECTISVAAEPEAIQWGHVEYSAQVRRWRRAWIHTATFLILAVGFVLLIYFNAQKEEAAATSDPAEKGGAQAWAAVATFAVVAINQLLKFAMKTLTPMEKAHTVDEEQGSVALRVWMCQALNTAILMLILRSEFGPVQNIPGDHFEQVNAKWYASVGQPLVGTMVIQFLTPPAFKLFAWVASTLRQCAQEDGVRTQNRLNGLMRRPDFDMAASYGELLLAATVTLLYGGGLPFLYWVAAAGFRLRYWADKVAILRLHRRPPLYGSGLFDSFDETAALLVLAHIAMSVYFLGTAAGVDPEGTIGFDPFRAHALPLFVVFCLASPAVLYKLFFVKEEEEEDAGDAPSFSHAYRSGRIVNEDDDYKMDVLEDLEDVSSPARPAAPAPVSVRTDAARRCSTRR